MLDLNQLRIFMAVWQQKGFSKASKAIHLTQPTISGHIKSLEEALGTKLFDRLGKEVTPTKAGEILYPYARKMFYMALEAEEAIKAFLGGTKGHLRIGGSNIPGQYLLPSLIGRFKGSGKGIDIILSISDTAGIADMVSSGEIELGMVGAAIDRANLVFEPCLDDQMVLIFPKGHRLDGLREVDFKDILSWSFVVREHGSGSRLFAEKALMAAGWPGFGKLNVTAEMGSTEAIRQAVKAGLGLAIISKRAVEDDIKNGSLAAAAIKGVELKRNFYLVWRRNKTLSPVALDFKKFLQKAGKDKPVIKMKKIS